MDAAVGNPTRPTPGAERQEAGAPRWRTALALAALAAVACAVNLTKAVHIDDTAHLEIAQGILADPLHPMSALVNWTDTAAPVAELNQPHLFFYLLAGVMVVCGTSELALHLAMAIAVCGTILAFWCLARRVARQHALTMTALFTLGPAFLPLQNLMVDVPLVGLWLLFFLGLCPENGKARTRDYLLSACAAAAACLVKYPSLVLLPVFAVVCGLRRHWRMLSLVLVPVTTLVAWSLFNVWDYGGVHILQRPTRAVTVAGLLVNAADWVAGLGAIAPFAIVFIRPANRCWLGGRALAGSLLVGLAVLVVCCVYTASSLSVALLWAVFAANGSFLVLTAAGPCVRRMVGAWRETVLSTACDPDRVLGLWCAAACSFFVLFTPFMAIRHILLALPAVLLWLGMHQSRVLTRPVSLLAVVVTALQGMAFAWADYQAADVYRDYAPRIRAELPADATVWFAGHWGWQWYARRAGLRQYDTVHTTLQRGEFLVIPENVHRQRLVLPHGLALSHVRQQEAAGGGIAVIRLMSRRPPGGFHAFSLKFQGPPWRFSTGPLEVFHVYQVVPAPPKQ